MVQVQFVILADAAVVTADGKFSILNGDLDTIAAPSFPAIHPDFAMVVKLSASPAEASGDHYFRAELAGPDGTLVVKPTNSLVPFARNQSDPDDQTATAGFVASFPLMVFPRPGKYLFHLFLDDAEIRTVPLYLKLREDADIEEPPDVVEGSANEETP